MESSLYSQFQINIENLVQNKVSLVKNFHIQPSEIDRMPYWEYEYFMKYANQMIEEENKQQEEQNEEYDMNSLKRNANSMMKGANSQMPKMPSMSSMPKMPSFSMPKI